ncbi:MAG: metallophosphatase family protein [Thermoleophilia bacterium]|nr:metallophosphatase family protein [Thermoleophilia bacterium]
MLLLVTGGPASIALLSDVHGNRVALEAVLEHLRVNPVDVVFCLGDLVGYGPEPQAVIDIVQQAAIPTVMGNYDEGIGWDKGDCGCYYATPRAREIGRISYGFTAGAVNEKGKAFLRQLPRELYVTLQDMSVHLVHGSPRRINEYLLPDRDDRTYLRLAAAEQAAALVFGHTHLIWSREYGNVLFVNVGSVGKPKDGDPRAAYVVLRAAKHRNRPLAPLEVEVRRVAYDIDAAARATLAAWLPEDLAISLWTGR